MNSKDWSLFLLRVGLGVLFFYAGWSKLTAATPFSAAGYLNSSTGPFTDLFKSLAGNALVDQLVIWGLLLGGAALILGVLTKLASVGLAFMMVLFYLSHFPPTAPNWYVDDHIIYFVALAVICSFEAGKVWGLGRYFERFGAWAV